ncbi:PREDICTED: RING finger protein 11, partial [Myotis davidii]|uniref:RING finger protein 11 n=1 Tax=Myotis davidii TaxID=225400 RepID=UPI00076748A4
VSVLFGPQSVPPSVFPPFNKELCPLEKTQDYSFLKNENDEQVPVPVYHPTPSQTRLATQLTEEEQIRIAQRIGLIQHLPKGVYDPGRDGSEKKIRECVICMMDFVYGDPIRFLPCMHIYHLDCIDDWLMRSFTCPSCMEPVDAALLSSYETN